MNGTASFLMIMKSDANGFRVQITNRDDRTIGTRYLNDTNISESGSV